MPNDSNIWLLGVEYLALLTRVGLLQKCMVFSFEMSREFDQIDLEDEKNRRSCEENPSKKSTHQYLLAATLIQDAVSSRNMSFKTDDKSVGSYIRFHHIGFKIMLYICLWGNIFVTLVEKPAVALISVHYWFSMGAEVIFMTVFSVRLGHAASFQHPMVFWRDPKNLVVFITILLTVIDMLGYCVWIYFYSVEVAIRWSRPLRPLLLINFPEGRQLRKAFRNIRRTLPDILHVLILFFASIALFTLLALKLFQNRNLSYPNGEPYFQNYWDGFWDLYVLVTTANNPDVKMPSYDDFNLYAVFFAVYLMLNLYVFMNIVLAVIYSNYKKHLKNEVQATVRHKHKLLSQAFDLLKIPQSDVDVATMETWHAVMAVVDPNKSRVQRDLLLSVLDTKGNNCIVRSDFLKVADLLNIELKVIKQEGSYFDRHCPPCYSSKINQLFIMGIQTRYFQWAFDLLILANAVCIGLNAEETEWFFLTAFTLEIILKFYAQGPSRYFTMFWNIFDFTAISAAWIVTIAGSAVGESDTRMRIIDVLMVLRILRLIRLAASFDRFKVVLVTIVNIGPSIATYGGVIFVVFYIYAIIGMEIFQNRITYNGYNLSANESFRFCGNPRLNGSEFVTKRYCSNNFNSISHALFLLFDLLVVNQWHVLADGFVRVTHKAARIYFITFHIICVIILLNIFTAFVLEAFLLEYTLSKGHLESMVEARIRELGLGVGQKPKSVLQTKSDRQELVDNMEIPDGSMESTSENIPSDKDIDEVCKPGANNNTNLDTRDAGLRFCLKKNRSKRLEALLQLMFEDDIDVKDDVGQHSVDGANKHSGADVLEHIL